ncbi:MAG: FtsX-like permease family protein [Clostridia bacterium]|nr:FtsX-like permease family protein [Clostridia bacterium]
MSNVLYKDTLRTIKKHFSRYISILLIVALGTAFFVGIKATAPDMIKTAETYFTDCNLMDLRITSSIGMSETDLQSIAALEGVKYIDGVKFTDAFVKINGENVLDIDGTRITTRAYSFSPDDLKLYLEGVNDGAYMNRAQLIEGRYPANVGECLVDASRLSTPESFLLGNVLTLETEKNERPSQVNTAQFTIVGVIRSPYYLSFERGNTDIGSGKIGTFIMIPEEAFDMDYYTEAYIKLTDSELYAPFSDEYIAYTDSFIEGIKSASGQLIATRISTLKPELVQKITLAEDEIRTGEEKANASMAELNATIETLQNLVDNGQLLIDKAQKEFDDQFSEAQNTIDTGNRQYALALEDYAQRKATLDSSEAAYKSRDQQYQTAKALYDAIKSEIDNANSQIASLESSIDQTMTLINSAQNIMDRIGDTQATNMSNDQIQSIITVMQTTYPELYQSISASTAGGLATEIIENVSPYLENEKSKLAQYENEIAEKKAALSTLSSQLEEKRVELEAAAEVKEQTAAQLEAAGKALENYSAQLEQANLDLQQGSLTLQFERLKKEADLNNLKNQIANAPAQLAVAQQKKAQTEEEVNAQLSAARDSLANARALYNRLENVSWDIYDRNDTPGYAGYGQSAQNIRVLSNIFPIFFFLISSLVCLTTVTRLVEEDRVLIGTYKAMGMPSSSILMKYAVYSLSACLIGAVIGISGGVFLFPYAINKAYSIMFTLPDLIYRFPVGYALLGLLIAVGSTLVVTVFAVLSDLRLSPGVLMRPKAPKKGKKILLERFKGIWSRLSFTAKVTMRNLFRNKSRFSMTMIGIMGCTALLLASLGMYNSLAAIKNRQYGENAITKYDFQIVFDDPQTPDVHSDVYNQVAGDARIGAMELISMKSMLGKSPEGEQTFDVYVFVPEAPLQMFNYISLRSRRTGARIELSDDGAVITEKLARETGTNVGDLIEFVDANGHSNFATVAAITENYTFHYIYMTPTYYERCTGVQPEYRYAIGNINESIKQSKMTPLESLKGLLATDIVKIEGVTTLAYMSETTKSIGEITNALSLVVVIFFVSAMILAFVVLYNLANINIIERTKELATLKVLGFNETEVSRYILRENIFLSFFGILFGIIGGIALHRLLITFIAVDAIMYGQSIAWYSYFIAVGITALFIGMVNLLLRRKTRRIDMVTSLKSVE